MNVNKININQQESSYYIASDIYDVSAHNNGVVFESLSALLSSSNLSTLIPTAVRCGGMTIRFVQSSDNKYVQYRLMSNEFTTNNEDWQGVDDEPTAMSDNLVKSDGVFSSISAEIARAKTAEEANAQAIDALNRDTPSVVDGNSYGGLDIADEKGFVIVRLSDGHIKTKNFDSHSFGKVIQTEDGKNILIIS